MLRQRWPGAAASRRAAERRLSRRPPAEVRCLRCEGPPLGVTKSAARILVVMRKTPVIGPEWLWSLLCSGEDPSEIKFNGVLCCQSRRCNQLTSSGDRRGAPRHERSSGDPCTCEGADQPCRKRMHGAPWPLRQAKQHRTLRRHVDSLALLDARDFCTECQQRASQDAGRINRP